MLGCSRQRIAPGSMIPRYTHPEMGAHLDRRSAGTRRGSRSSSPRPTRWPRRASSPPTPRASCARSAAFDIARIEEIEQTTQHDVIAFTTAVAEQVGPAARWLHFGLTSSDVVDTALALQMRDACDLILKDLDALAEAVRTRAEEHRKTPMIGRTHGVHAEPMTFGLKLALWYAELQRDVDARRARARRRRGRQDLGRGRHVRALPPSIEAAVCRRLGLQPAPVSSQVIQRDRHAELLTALAITGASLEKFALEIRGLQKTEIGEVEEPFAQGAEGLVGDAAQAQPDRLRADLRPGAAAARQRHGGAREHRAVARARHLALVGRARDPARQLHRARPHAPPVHADRARAWSSIRSGCSRISAGPAAWCFPGTVLLELAARGVSREQAYQWVQRNAMRSFQEQARFQDAAARRCGRHRACCAPARSSAPSISTSSSATSTRSSRRVFQEVERRLNDGACVRDAQAVRVRSAGPHHHRGAALAGLRRRRGRAAGQVLRADAAGTQRRGARSWRPKWPTSCSRTP